MLNEVAIFQNAALMECRLVGDGKGRSGGGSRLVQGSVVVCEGGICSLGSDNPTESLLGNTVSRHSLETCTELF